MPTTPDEAFQLATRFLNYATEAPAQNGTAGLYASVANTYASIATGLLLEQVVALLATPEPVVEEEPEESPADRRRRLDRERKAESRAKAAKRDAELAAMDKDERAGWAAIQADMDRIAADDGPEATYLDTAVDVPGGQFVADEVDTLNADGSRAS
jgi:hypothetical protein